MSAPATIRAEAVEEMRKAGLIACSANVNLGEWSITRGAEEVERLRDLHRERGEIGGALRMDVHLAALRFLAFRAGEGGSDA